MFKILMGTLLCAALLSGCAKTGPDNFEITEATIKEGFESGRILYDAEPYDTPAPPVTEPAADAAVSGSKTGK